MRALPALLLTLVVLAGCAGLAGDTGTPSPVPSTDAPLDGTTAPGTVVTVVDVVDGDTVDVRYPNGTTDTVRLLGIDTPEVHVANDPAEFEGVPDTGAGAACLREAGEAAGAALRERVAGGQVGVVVDGTADRRGGYGRLLAYLVHDGTDLNRWLVAQGHARVYDTTFARSEAYYAAESEAQAAGRGLWRCQSPER